VNQKGTLVLATVTALLVGCGPQLWAVSTPPPTRTAAHAYNPFDDDTIRLSVGVALAFDCYEGLGESCTNASASTADGETAIVRPAFLERKPSTFGVPTGPAPRTGFVLIAKRAGTTTLTVQSSEGVTTTEVIVE
jgi:hypothetical protein